MKNTTYTISKLFQSIITVCIVTSFSIAQNTFSVEVGEGTIDVLYNSDTDIGGFQFAVEGATVTGASGGDAAANGFMISCSSTMCLGFSLTGSVIPAGSGTLVIVSADIIGDVYLAGIVVSDSTGIALDFTYDYGGSTDITDGCDLPDFNLYLTDDGSVLYNSHESIGGFQFTVEGATVTGASGGDAAANGFMISCSSTMCLGFSMTGTTFGPGCGTMVVISFDGDATGLSGIVISDSVGDAILFEYYSGNGSSVLGCMDDIACNYNADATEDDGTCTYAEDNYDCDGNCTAGEDCFGECGGSAVMDECGECGGSGIGGHACDCAGNVDDCSGVCGGSAIVDECGVCAGNGTSCIPVQLGFGAVSDGNMEITYNSPIEIAGFQFNLMGVNITSVSGGAAGENGFMISSNLSTVIGFSLTGATIPAGMGVLIELTYEATAAEQACLDSPVISDTNGEGLNIEIGSCADLDFACDDVDADGICDDVDDCVGAYDECGECNGDGIDEGECDCDGNVEDCAGECGGSAIVDECGECGGDGSSCVPMDVDFSIDLIAGYNWISFNVVPEDNSLEGILGSLGTDANFVMSQSDGVSNNYGDYGWYGSLGSMEPEKMYLLEMLTVDTLIVTGNPVDVASTPISLISGYNWIGYLPQNPGALEAALASLGTDANFVMSQSDGVSTNYGAYGWYGSLLTMEPGNGYLLEMLAPGELYYPEFDGLARLSENKQEVVLTETISHWDFNYGDYQYIGTVTASIESREDFDGDIVGVFVGDECRGIAERMYFPFNDSYLYIIQVYSNVKDGEEMTLKYYDSENDEVVEYSETLTFTSNMMVGDGFNTLSLIRERGLSRPTVYGIGDAYPNPFNPVTSFNYTIEKDGMVNVSVYDISGRMVAELVNGYTSAGSYPVVWDASELSSGVYMVHMIAGDYSTMQKVMLIK